MHIYYGIFDEKIIFKHVIFNTTYAQYYCIIPT